MFVNPAYGIRCRANLLWAGQYNPDTGTGALHAALEQRGHRNETAVCRLGRSNEAKWPTTSRDNDTMKLNTDTMVVDSGRARSATEQSNLDVVMSAYRALSSVNEADVDMWYDTAYLDHAPTVPNGDLQALKAYIKFFDQAYPAGEITLDQLLADGDFVYVASRGRLAADDEWSAIMEVFRLASGRIIEHWEGIQPPVTPFERFAGEFPRSNVKVTADDGARLAVQINGPATDSAVVFLHGVTSSRGTYDWLPEQITEGRRIITYDHRGHGESEHRAGTYQLAQYVKDAVTVLDTVVGYPVVLVGFSLGGLVAWTIAQQRPDLVRAVFLEEPPLFPEYVYANDDVTSVLRWTIEQEKIWRERGDELDAITRELADSPYGPGTTQGEATYPESVRTLAFSLMVRDRGVTESAIDGAMVEGLDTRSSIGVPALLLVGDESAGGVFTKLHAQALSATHPDVTVHRAAGSGHAVHSSFAGREPYLRLLSDFLDTYAPRPRRRTNGGPGDRR
jgi:pimeloyl-ACP methyl ester carboxylesterase/predicted SnoaL-like aldol condensation-catalyzing enzyme